MNILDPISSRFLFGTCVPWNEIDTLELRNELWSDVSLIMHRAVPSEDLDVHVSKDWFLPESVTEEAGFSRTVWQRMTRIHKNLIHSSERKLCRTLQIVDMNLSYAYKIPRQFFSNYKRTGTLDWGVQHNHFDTQIHLRQITRNDKHTEHCQQEIVRKTSRDDSRTSPLLEDTSENKFWSHERLPRSS